MGEVRALFSPARWLADWEALGGFVNLGEEPFGEDGQRMTGMSEWMPCSDRASAAERVKIEVLRRQVRSVDARLQVIDFIARRAATRGW